MNKELFTIGILEILLSFITGLFVFLAGLKGFDIFTKTINETEEIKNNNIAVGILCSAFLVSIFIIVSPAVSPTLEALKGLIQRGSENINFAVVLITCARIVVFYLCTGILAFLLIFLSLVFFMFLTKDMDEMKLIKSGNISVALLLSSMMLSISLLSLGPVKMVIKAFSSQPFLNNVPVRESFVEVPLLLKGGSSLLLALLGGVLVFFVSFRLFTLLTRKIDDVSELKRDNTALSTLASSFIFSTMIIIKTAVTSSLSILSSILPLNGRPPRLLIFSFLRILAFYGFSTLSAIVIIWLSMQIYMLLTLKINEMKEIKRGNLSVALIISIFILTLSFLMQNGITTLLESTIPLPPIGEGGIADLPIR